MTKIVFLKRIYNCCKKKRKKKEALKKEKGMKLSYKKNIFLLF